MIALYIILVLFTLFLFTLSIWIDEDSELKGLISGLGYISFLFVILITFVEFYPERYNRGQIDALKGEQHYEIQYVYPAGDTIPVDTLYTKVR